MVRTGLVSFVIVLLLGCAGSTEFNESFEKGFHDSFIESCAPAGAPAEQKQMCTCVANKVVKTKTPAELTAMLADPEEALKPFVEICGKKMSRQQGR